jgi:DNA-binding transcriptional LysR family regulator
VRLALASNEALLELAGTGMGLAVLSRHALGDRLAVEGLVVVDVEGFPLHRPWNLVHCGTRFSRYPPRPSWKTCAGRLLGTLPDTEDGAATLR